MTLKVDAQGSPSELEVLERMLPGWSRSDGALHRSFRTTDVEKAIAEARSYGDAVRSAEKKSERL